MPARLLTVAVICALAAVWYVWSERARTQSLGEPIYIGVDVEQGSFLERARLDIVVRKGHPTVSAIVGAQARCDAGVRTRKITVRAPEAVSLEWVASESDGATAVGECQGDTAFVSARLEIPTNRVLRRLGAGRWYFDVSLLDDTTVKFDPVEGNLTAAFEVDSGRRLDDVYGSPFMSTPTDVMWFGHVRSVPLGSPPTLRRSLASA